MDVEKCISMKITLKKGQRATIKERKLAEVSKAVIRQM